MTRLAPYAGEKGKLRFLRCERMPYSLIGEIASVRARQNDVDCRFESRRPVNSDVMRLSLLTRLLLIVGGVLALASSCVAKNAQGIRSVDFRNFTYNFATTKFVLHDGSYHEGDADSWHSYTLSRVEYFDFDRDRRDEAFLVVDYRTSGTYDHGQEYFVFAYRRGNAQMIFHESREKPFDVRVGPERRERECARGKGERAKGKIRAARSTLTFDC